MHEPQCRGQAQFVGAVTLDLRDRAVAHRRPVAQLVQRDTGASPKLVEIDREPIRDCGPQHKAILASRRRSPIRFEINQLPPALGTVDRFRTEVRRQQTRSPHLAGAPAVLARLPPGRFASVHRCAPAGTPSAVVRGPRQVGGGPASKDGNHLTSLWPAPRPSNNRRWKCPASRGMAGFRPRQPRWPGPVPGPGCLDLLPRPLTAR